MCSFSTDLFPQLLDSASHLIDLSERVYQPHPREEILVQRYLEATSLALDGIAVHPVRRDLDLLISTRHMFTFFAAGTPGRELDALSMTHLPPSSHMRLMSRLVPMAGDNRLGTYRLCWDRGDKRPGIYEGVTANGELNQKFGLAVRHENHRRAIERNEDKLFYRFANQHPGTLRAYTTFAVEVEDKENANKRALPKAARMLAQYAVEGIRHVWMKTVYTTSPTDPGTQPHIGLNPRSSIGEAVAQVHYMSTTEQKTQKSDRRSARNKIAKALETSEQREARLVVEREKEAEMKSRWSEEKRSSYLAQRRVASAKRKARETEEQAEKRRKRHAAEERRRKQRLRDAKAAERD